MTAQDYWALSPVIAMAGLALVLLSADALLAELGRAMLAEDAGFHSFQIVDAGLGQYQERRGTESGRHVLIGMARYLAAHAPTSRAVGQTFQIALRLHRGEELFRE